MFEFYNYERMHIRVVKHAVMLGLKKKIRWREDLVVREMPVAKILKDTPNI